MKITLLLSTLVYFHIHTHTQTPCRKLEKALTERHLRQARAKPPANPTPARRLPAIAAGGRIPTNERTNQPKKDGSQYVLAEVTDKMKTMMVRLH